MARIDRSVNMNLDSLMDTLTNVVGFLVMVMTLMRVSVTETVRRIRAADPAIAEVAVDILDEAQRRADAQDRQQKDLLEKLRDLRQRSDNVNGLLASLAVPADEGVGNLPQTPNLGELRRLLEQRKARSDDLRKKVEAADGELARLKALLDETPLPKSRPAREIALPNPRTAPDGAKRFQVMCRYNEIAPVDLLPLRKMAEGRISLAKGDLERVRKTFSGNQRVGNELFQLRMDADPATFQPRLFIEYRKGGGDSIVDLGKTNSRFQRFLREVQRDKGYIQFLVWSDSYEAYLEARRVADEQGIAAGWEVFNPSHSYRDWGFGAKVRLHVKGKPVPPPAKPRPAPPKTPRPPRDEID